MSAGSVDVELGGLKIAAAFTIRQYRKPIVITVK